MTQVEATEQWIATNSAWLTDDHAPMVQQLRILAASMDTDLAAEGKVQASVASAYRMSYRTLMEQKFLGDRPAIPGLGGHADDDLLNPA